MSGQTNSSVPPWQGHGSSERIWLTTTDVSKLIWELEHQHDMGFPPSDRKLRLFACACAREFSALFFDQACEDAIEITEWFCDGEAERSELGQADSMAQAVAKQSRGEVARAAQVVVDATELHAMWAASYTSSQVVSEATRDQEIAHRCNLLRDIFGNPFRPVTLEPRWLSSTVLDLARTIYDEKLFERMPILGDALLDAGCDSEEIIQHCQGAGSHVRGCWVVDLLLGKT